MKKGIKTPLAVKDIAMIGMMCAVIEVCKVALMGLPNIELTTFWIIMFTLYFGCKVFYVIPVFILIEGAMFGFGIWWIMYLYMWPMLAVVTGVILFGHSVFYQACSDCCLAFFVQYLMLLSVFRIME